MTFEKNEGDSIILATGGYDHTIKLWQTHTGICQRTMQHAESQVNALEISPDRLLLASASYQHIYMYDLASNNANSISDYEGTTKNVTDVGFQEFGKWMYSGGEDCRVRIWDLRSRNNSNGNQAIKLFEVQAPVTSVCLHPNQVELFVGDQSGVIYRWDLRTDNNEQLIPESDAMILDIDIDRQGKHMAAVNNKANCYIWGLESGMADTPTKMLPKSSISTGLSRSALKCVFSPDGEYLVTTSADHHAQIWSTSNNFKLCKTLTHENQRWVWDAAFSADSQYVFTASSDGLARLWNVKTGVKEREYAGHQKAITALAFREGPVK